jgi:hypothetical protein
MQGYSSLNRFYLGYRPSLAVRTHTEFTLNTHLLAWCNAEINMVKYIRQVGLKKRCQVVSDLGHLHGRTAYRMARSSHCRPPADGQDGGGRGSVNSGPSRGSSEYSLTLSMATCKGESGSRQNQCVPQYHRLFQPNKTADLR